MLTNIKLTIILVVLILFVLGQKIFHFLQSGNCQTKDFQFFFFFNYIFKLLSQVHENMLNMTKY